MRRSKSVGGVREFGSRGKSGSVASFSRDSASNGQVPVNV